MGRSVHSVPILVLRQVDGRIVKKGAVERATVDDFPAVSLKAGRQAGRQGGRQGGREEGREEGRKGGREGGRQGGREGAPCENS